MKEICYYAVKFFEDILCVFIVFIKHLFIFSSFFAGAFCSLVI